MRGMLAYYDACPYCGKRLKHVDVNLFGKTYSVGCWASCGCAEAIADDEGATDQTRPYSMAGVPARYLGASCDMGGNDLAVMNGRSLYITGPYGSGKTYYASSVAKSLVDNGFSVMFVNSSALVADIHATYSGQGTGLLDRAMGCQVLVLDDLGKEQPTAHTLALFYELVDARYVDMKPMVCTSNFSRGDLLRRWADADLATAESIVSRLCENSNVVTLKGRDRRLA